MIKVPKTISQDDLSNYISNRGESFIKAYEGFKSMVLGDSVEKTIKLSNGNIFKVKFDSIKNEVCPNNIEINNSVKVWPTFNEPSSNFYYDTVDESNLPIHSVIRLSPNVDEKYNHINVLLGVRPSLLFIVLDKTYVDGLEVEFKINFIHTINGNNNHQVILIDGSVNNICACDNGLGVIIDGIKLSYDLNPESNYLSHNNVSKLGINDAIISSRFVRQITDNIQNNGFTLSNKKYEKLDYNNYGLYDDEHIVCYKNDENILVCRGIDKQPSNNWVDFSGDIIVDENSVLLMSNPNTSNVFGLSSNLNIITNKVFTSTFTHNIDALRSDYLVNELPNQFIININNPTNSFSSSIIIHDKVSLDLSGGIVRVRHGIRGCDLSGSVLFNSQGKCIVHSEGGNSSTAKISTDIISNTFDIVTGILFDKNILKIKTTVFDGDVIICESEYSSIHIDNMLEYLPYKEYYIESNTNVSQVYVLKNTIVHSLTPNELSDYIKLVNTVTHYDYNDSYSNLSRKYLPIKNIEGYIASINPTVSINYESNVSDITNDISYRLSLVYHKNKSDFYYTSNNKWKLSKGTKSEKVITYVGCRLVESPIDFTKNGIQIDGGSYYGNTHSLKNTQQLFKNNMAYGTDLGILFNNCNSQKSSSLAIEYGYGSNNDTDLINNVAIKTFKYLTPISLNGETDDYSVKCGLSIPMIANATNQYQAKFINTMYSDASMQYYGFLANTAIRDSMGNRLISRTKIKVEGTIQYSLDNRALIYVKSGQNKIINNNIVNIYPNSNGLSWVLPVKTINVKLDPSNEEDNNIARDLNGLHTNYSSSGAIDYYNPELYSKLNTIFNATTSYISLDDENNNTFSRVIYSYDIINGSGDVISTTNIMPTGVDYRAYAVAFILSIGDVNNIFQINLNSYDIANNDSFKQSIGEYLIDYDLNRNYELFDFRASSNPIIDIKWRIDLYNDISDYSDLFPSLNIKNTYNRPIKFNKLESEYISGYVDNFNNSGGWKISGYYQLPINN